MLVKQLTCHKGWANACWSSVGAVKTVFLVTGTASVLSWQCPLLVKKKAPPNQSNVFCMCQGIGPCQADPSDYLPPNKSEVDMAHGPGSRGAPPDKTP